ncbi:hypothetical protein DVA67_016470 [Solirubrobacter sp. CPCC 204708]|uniref:PASTA domain-containing protein n=1 Tax=Solirubrobacter deserti TaxID=2282478 RepID=A0ABT4RRQ9_9ACTN|nr:hypothetical protein [Solirubrobacter deserti]MBE2317579.1 hypothetical protein [Solirubrobacter deserti]MDA0141273.1 hypothetical protein [Solirubrobacter deserti]
MTPLPPELALLREDLAAAARRRARRRRWPRVLVVSGFVTLTFGTAAVGTGLVESPFSGDERTVTVEGERIPCTRTARGELCRFRPGEGVGPAQLARALRARGAEFGVTETRSANAYNRTGIRVGERPAGRGGYRSTGPLTVTITVDGGAPVTCGRTGPICRAYREDTRRGDFQPLLRTLDARRIVIETTSRCRLAKRYECEGAPRERAIRLSRDPQAIPEPSTTYSYARLTVTRR